MRLLPLASAAICFCAMPQTAFATKAGIESGDNAWILTATTLVLMMTLPGLALFYPSLVQAKNVVTELMHHFALASYVILRVISLVIGLSVDQQDEIEGLDLSQRGERGYHSN